MKQKGFTLIELMITIAMIGFIASIILIAFDSVKEKSRNTKRTSDIIQLTKAIEQYNTINQGYPPSLNALTTGSYNSLSTLPTAPLPPDGSCTQVQNTYTYFPAGSIDANGNYQNFNLSFCLGAETGSYSAGVHTVDSSGIH